MARALDVLLVSFYYHPDQTGVAPYSTGLARGLVERGHRVRAVVGYPHYPQWRIADGYTGLRRREVVDGVEVVHVRHPVPRSSTGLAQSYLCYRPPNAEPWCPSCGEVVTA